MKILVTGGAGFIGSHTVDRLILEGMQVVVVDNMTTGRSENVHPKSQFYHADIAGPEMRGIMERELPDVCIHLAEAPIPSQGKPLGAMNPDMRGLIYLLDLCREFNVKKLVYGSSAEVYGTKEMEPVDETYPCAPKSALGFSKLAPEEYIKAFANLFGLDYTILRYSAIYGNRGQRDDFILSRIMNSVMDGSRPPVYGKHTRYWDFLHVSDAAEANLLAISRGSGQTYNIGSGRIVGIEELLLILQDLFNVFVRPVYKTGRAEDKQQMCLNIDKVRNEWNWQPRISLEEGLVMTMGEHVHRLFMEKLREAPYTKSLRPVQRKKWARRTSSL